ncbi:MAG: hypothetical protein QOE26_1875 [Verrucomicrobiota bacterium]|jgi:hypothetical protein
MKSNGKAPKNIAARELLKRANEHSRKIKFVASMARLMLKELIKNARAAQACAEALNIPAAKECLDQLTLRAGATRNNLQQLRDLLK